MLTTQRHGTEPRRRASPSCSETLRHFLFVHMITRRTLALGTVWGHFLFSRDIWKQVLDWDENVWLKLLMSRSSVYFHLTATSVPHAGCDEVICFPGWQLYLYFSCVWRLLCLILVVDILFADAVKVRLEIGWLISINGSLESFIFLCLLFNLSVFPFSGYSP